MLQDVRIVAKGYYGRPNPPAFTFNLTADKVWRYLLATGNATGLQRLRDNLRDDDFHLDRKDLRFGGDLTTASPLILDYAIQMNGTQSQTSAFRDALNGGQYYIECAQPFSANVTGLMHSYSSPGSPLSSRYISTFNIGLNQPFTVRMLIPKPPQNLGRFFNGLRFGTQDNGVWQFQIVNGKPEIAILSAAWTQTQEDTLNAALNTPGSLTADQVRTINTYRSTIYKAYKTLEIGHSHDAYYGVPITLTFIPEPRGVLNIILEGGGGAAVHQNDILVTRQPGIMWGPTPLTIYGNGGAYVWQCGTPVFSPLGILQYPFRTSYTQDQLNDAIMNGIWDTSAGNGATDVSLDYLVLSNNIDGLIQAQLTTSNNLYTPFLYVGQALLPASVRDGSQTTAWDSNDHLDANGVGPVEECNVETSSERNQSTRQTSLTLKMRNNNGTLAFPGFYYEALENRMCDVYIGGSLFLKNGIVHRANTTDMMAFTTNLPAIDVTRPETKAMLYISDMWFILDEQLMDDDIIGDGMHLSDYLILILRNAGEYNGTEDINLNSTPNYLAGITSGTGPILPVAALGEAPAVRPGAEQSRGDYIRSLMVKYGKGWQLYLVQGVWYFTAPSNTVATIEGHTANFVSTPGTNTADSYPGRLALLSPLDLNREYNDVFNWIRVQGAPTSNGRPLVVDYPVWESILGQNDAGYRGCLGRIKRMPTINDPAVRTYSDAYKVARSAAGVYATSGAYYSFLTYFHRALTNGMVITADGILGVVESITGASTLDDRSTVIMRAL